MAKILDGENRSDLRRRTLTSQQINAIEARLPLAKGWLQKMSSMTDVKKNLVVVRDELKSTGETLRLLLEGTSPAQVEARNWLIQADDEEDGDGTAIEAAIQAIDRAELVAKRALHALPRVQRHTNEINRRVIQTIDEALMHGSSSHGAGAIERSSTPNSDYSEVMRICMVAMGRQDVNPERAIKAYIKWLKGRPAVVGRG